MEDKNKWNNANILKKKNLPTKIISDARQKTSNDKCYIFFNDNKKKVSDNKKEIPQVYIKGIYKNFFYFIIFFV